MKTTRRPWKVNDKIEHQIIAKNPPDGWVKDKFHPEYAIANFGDWTCPDQETVKDNAKLAVKCVNAFENYNPTLLITALELIAYGSVEKTIEFLEELGTEKHEVICGLIPEECRPVGDHVQDGRYYYPALLDLYEILAKKVLEKKREYRTPSIKKIEPPRKPWKEP